MEQQQAAARQRQLLLAAADSGSRRDCISQDACRPPFLHRAWHILPGTERSLGTERGHETVSIRYILAPSMISYHITRLRWKRQLRKKEPCSSNCSGKECWGTILRKGKRSSSKNTYGSVGKYQVWGLGLLYSAKESVVIREYGFLCAIQEGKRQILSNKSCEGWTCTCSGEENARV